MRTAKLNPLTVQLKIVAFLDSYYVICTLLLLLDGAESLIIRSYILLADQFVITTLRIASWNFSVLHFGLFKMKADCRVCPGQIICKDIALFVCVCKGNVKFSFSSVKYLQGPATLSSTLSDISFGIRFYCYKADRFLPLFLSTKLNKKKKKEMQRQ